MNQNEASESNESDSMPVYKFTPDLDIETLKEITVGREKQVNRILEELKSAAEGNYRNHYLIVGPRGIGKTHFILLLHHAIKNGELSNHFIPVKFAEEEYSIISINHLFSKAVQRLCMEEGQEIGEMREILTRPLFKDVEHALEALRRLKKETGKRLLLMLENLHLLFGALGKQGISRLRSILQEEDTFTIIGTAPVILDEVANARQPLYHFFKQETLPALTDPQTLELLQKLEKKTSQTRIDFKSDGDKIKALNILTGGYPRLILWLYDILAASRIIDVEGNLLNLLDELSSYYTLRMEGMPPQQRAIFDTIAQFHEPVGPKQISDELGLDARKVSTQLQRMTRSGYIRKVYPGKRRKRALYEIADRLFRYWREIREPFGRERIGLLIRFFKLWFSPEQLVMEFEKYEEQIRTAYHEGKGEVVRECLGIVKYITEATSESHIVELHGRLVELYRETELMDDAENEIERLKRKGKELGRKELEFAALMEELKHYHNTSDNDRLRKSIDEIMKFDRTEIEVWKIKAKLFDEMNLYNETFQCYYKLTELAPLEPRIWLASGNYFYKRGRWEEALEKYERALELYTELSEKEPENNEYIQHIAGIQTNIGNILKNLGKWTRSLDKYQNALEKFDQLLSRSPNDKMFQSYVAMTSNNLGNLLRDLGRREEALEKYQRALDMREALLKNDPVNIVFQSDVATTSNNLGTLLGDLGRREEALEKYQRALDMREALLKNDSVNIVFQSYVATTSNNLGTLLSDLGQMDEAKEHHQRALELREALMDKDPDNIVFQSDVAQTCINLGNLLRDLGKFDDAEKYYEKASIYESVLPDKGVRFRIAQSGFFILQKREDDALSDGTRALEIARNLGWKNEIEGAQNNLMRLHFMISRDSLSGIDPGKAHQHLSKALAACKETSTEVAQEFVISYLRSIAPLGDLLFISAALKAVFRILGKEYAELLEPYSRALEYAMTGDADVLLTLQQEQRELAIEIAEMMKGSEKESNSE